MGSQKSHPELEQVLLSYLSCLVIDLYEALSLTSRLLRARPDFDPAWCAEFPRFDREAKADISYIRRRVFKEGIGFLAHALPNLDRALLGFLERGLWANPIGFEPFVSNVRGVKTPRFLRAFWRLVLITEFFTVGDDVVMKTAVGRVIRVARSIFRSCDKLDLPYEEELVQRKLNGFKEIEKELQNLSIDPENPIVVKARHVVANVLRGFEPLERAREGLKPWDCIPEEWLPRHGPGAVATGERDEQKWAFGHIYASLDWAFPYREFAMGMRYNGLPAQYLLNLDHAQSVSRHEYARAKLVVVPKDARGPRLISEEPLELQFMQQAIARPLMDHLEKWSRWSRGHINFVDQSINGKLALEASRDRQLATLDMKDASDRVSLALFRMLWPLELQPMFLALRSYATVLPGGEEVWLEKYAPMGSALCFPVESLLFYAITVASLAHSRDCTLWQASRSVFVYGDDILSPAADAYAVMDGLEQLGLAVNWDKSFVMGHFRESCGIDAWHGQVVTPVRLRRVPGHSPAMGENIVAWCSYADALWGIGCRHAMSYVEQLVEDVVGWIPTVDRPAGYLSYVRPGRATGINGYPALKVHASLQQLTSQLYVLRQKQRDVRFESGWQQLMRGVISPSHDCDPSRIPVRGAVALRRKRVIVYA